MAANGWCGIPIDELFDLDTRPTYVVDIFQSPSTVVYLNPAAEVFEASTKKVVWPDLRDAALYFKDWVVSSPLLAPPSYRYQGEWVAVLMRDRWKVITGSPNRVDSRLATQGVQRLDSADSRLMPSTLYDWTAIAAPRNLNPYAQFLRNFDWAKTGLGPMKMWSAELRLMANLIMVDPHPAKLLWGPEMIAIYNEQFLPLVHGKHPRCLGLSCRDTWGELYDSPAIVQALEDSWHRGRSQGKSTMMTNQLFFLLIDGQLQERFFDLKLLPVIGISGETIAFHEILSETTAQILYGRREACVRHFCDLKVANTDDFYSKVMGIFDDMVEDIPFAIAWSLRFDAEEEIAPPGFLSEEVNRTSIMHEAAIGVPLDPSGCPVAHSLLAGNPSFVSAVKLACQNLETVRFSLAKDSNISHLLTLGERGFGDLPSLAILGPIMAGKQRDTLIFMIGINPRCPFDEKYEQFIKALLSAITSTFESLDAQEALERTQEAVKQEQRAKSMVEASPVGSFMMRVDGEMIYVNSSWYDITGYDLAGGFNSESWLDIIHNDDRTKMASEWHKLSVEKQPRSFELRLKKQWHTMDTHTEEYRTGATYILVSALFQSMGDEDLVTGAITDISQQKWSEDVQMHQKDEALALKRAQENFIDMTSHEMRNPLSAIFQCAESILSTLSKHISSSLPRQSELLETALLSHSISDALESARTITLCAQHQKRIVDDVLVLSKFEARLIEVCPVDVQPKVLLEDIKNMFKSEVDSDNINLIVQINPSYAELEVDWVKLDPGRLLQVLINFCSNAIKFTRDMPKRREIKMGLGAAREAPSHSTHGVRYLSLPSELKKGVEDHTGDSEWGEGEILYLRIEVIDSGKGMTTDEMERLFQKFTQTSPRTHTKYGGTGLGLFIARLLIGLQGGEVGASSTPDVGSIFAFYVKCRRSSGPIGANKAQHSSIQSPISETATPFPARSCSNFSILIVEDNLVNQKVLSRQLKRLGFTIHTANDGREAFEFILDLSSTQRRHELSLILMDVEMPIMGGVEATTRIRGLEREQQALPITILGITANARPEQLRNALRAGMDDVVTKPFKIQDLLTKLEMYLGPLVPGDSTASE